MSTPDKRHTRIDFDALRIRRGHTQTEETQSSLGTSKRTASDASLGDLASARRRGIVYSTNVEKRAQLARPPHFPVNANGLIVKPGDPWQDFEVSHRLRFGVDYRVTVAERKSSPYDIVAIRTFSGVMEQAQVRMLRGIQHDNFTRTLDVFQSTESTYVVFEQAHVSLHEISRSRAKITKIELAAILGQVGSQRCFSPGRRTDFSSWLMGLCTCLSKA